MATIKVRRLKQIPAEITVPGDKSISHRAAMFAGLAKGRTEISGFLPSAKTAFCTVHAMESMGAKVEWLEETPGVGFTKLAITGNGMKLQPPARLHRVRELRHHHAPARGHPCGATLHHRARKGDASLQAPDEACG